MNVHNSGEYEGIGAWVNIEGELVTIVSPMTGSPAERAGLKPNDVIIGVDGKDVTGIDGSVVLDMILGPAGTKIVLTIQRESVAEPFDVEIIREKITIPSVEGEMLEDDIAYIRINTFGEKTTSELKGYLKDLMGQDPVGLVVDLRNNGGGYVQTCIEVVSQFILGNKVVMYEEYGDGTRQTLKSYSGGLATDIPLVVLVNEGTASASEIMAGAIQDYDRGVLVGVTTFGKGSVQNLIPLSDDQGAIRVTVARWLTPNERHIHEIGLDPDYVVELTDEDIEAEQDPQLDKAIQLILGGDTQLN
jgi:carboxyl-terminal processing protease